MDWFDKAEERAAWLRTREEAARDFRTSFSLPAQKALDAAAAEARRLNFGAIGAEHLLLGLVELIAGTVPKAFADRGWRPEVLRSEAEKARKPGPQGCMPKRLPFTPRMKRVLRTARREARAQGRSLIESDDLLAALVAEAPPEVKLQVPELFGNFFLMPVQTQHRFNVKDYHRMAATGVIRPDARVELLDGRILDMSPIGPFHGGVVNRLTRLFHKLSRGRWLVSAQNPLRLDEFSEPEPDVMLLKPAADDYTSRHPQAEDVLLLIEVSDTTIEFDRKEKLPTYARACIAEVWIVNLSEAAIEVYREPNFSGYDSKAILRAGEQARPLAFPDAEVAVSELLKR